MFGLTNTTKVDTKEYKELQRNYAIYYNSFCDVHHVESKCAKEVRVLELAHKEELGKLTEQLEFHKELCKEYRIKLAKLTVDLAAKG